MLKEIIITLLVAMVPVIELRGALPIGVGLGLSPVLATIISIIGNLAPIPFLLLLVPKIFAWLRDKKLTRKFITWLENKAEKHQKTIDKYGYLGLIILVAIPLPGTGAWTGALVASCLQLQKRKSIFAITIGVLIAAFIVFAITYGFTQIL